MGALAQTKCAEQLPFTPVSVPNRVEWSKFSSFSLPDSFTLIYGGPRLAGDANGPLTHGFTHLVRPRPEENAQPRQRALEYSGFAYGLNQPWETLESPWGNDLGVYRSKWTAWLRDQSGGQVNAAGQFVLPAEVLMVDIERVLETDAAILRLKQNTATPAPYRNLADTDFLRQYKRDMTALYATGLRFLREKADLSRTKLSTYSDVPIRNAYANVVANSWTDWTTNPTRLSFLTTDSTGLRLGGAFYDQLDFLSPSSYYYYDYPNPLAPDFLAYSLFQVEANRAWSNKPVLPFVWMRFHECCGNNPNFIPANMAEATAIFPFFSGAKGLWFWDQLSLSTTRQDVHAAYEYFIHGLYRLSQFKQQFTGNYELVIETNARDLMDGRKPVWRGIFNQNQLLVAAHNPYATDGQTTTIPISYKGWQGSITLTGREIAICQYDLSLLATENLALPDLNVYPNPARHELTIIAPQPDAVQLIDLQGRVLRQIPNISGPLRLDISTLPAGLYLIRNGGITKQIVVEK
ncbi:T9SS type A sorting domain-containing protein [Fibrella sp. HMF5335]|uniref:T9SS type A sorting domain-containing protein n=1 Tax=Fibrella rubiginis TaxID=2817060 RepID=A0A939GNI6_9BACT|nr:T9SS type A sorting domain-containing protein [Fibrella rubiginis]